MRKKYWLVRIPALILAALMLLPFSACSRAGRETTEEKEEEEHTRHTRRNRETEDTEEEEETARRTRRHRESETETEDMTESGAEETNEPRTRQQETSEAPVETDFGSGEIRIWDTYDEIWWTEMKVRDFLDAHPEYSGYTVSVEAVELWEVLPLMTSDVDAVADLFFLYQDSIAELVTTGTIAPPTGDTEWIREQNDAGSVAAATLGDVVYAYPMTSDNGYFLFYDKSVITDPSTLEGILDQCERAGRKFYMEINSGWYQTAFFFAAGCKLDYTSNSEGGFDAADITYASEGGVNALRAMMRLAQSPAFVNGSSVSSAVNAAAVVSGLWDTDSARSLFGDNYAACKLPTVGLGGRQVQMSGFGGFRLMGIKPQSEEGKLAVCMELARYLTGPEMQLERFAEVGFSPSNKEAQQSDAVRSNAAAAAMADQAEYIVPMRRYPGDYWDLARTLADIVIAGGFDGASDAELMVVLEEFQDDCLSLVTGH